MNSLRRKALIEILIKANTASQTGKIFSSWNNCFSFPNVNDNFIEKCLFKLSLLWKGFLIASRFVARSATFSSWGSFYFNHNSDFSLASTPKKEISISIIIVCLQSAFITIQVVSQSKAVSPIAENVRRIYITSPFSDRRPRCDERHFNELSFYFCPTLNDTK